MKSELPGNIVATYHDIIYEYRWEKRWRSVGLFLVFIIFTAGGWTVISAMMSGRGITVQGWIFIGIFVLLALGFLWAIAGYWMNRTIIYIDDGANEVVLMHTPVPWLGGKRIRIGEIEQLGILEEGEPLRWAVRYRDARGGWKVLVKGLVSRSLAHRIERKIERRLAITDEPGVNDVGSRSMISRGWLEGVPSECPRSMMVMRGVDDGGRVRLVYRVPFLRIVISSVWFGVFILLYFCWLSRRYGFGISSMIGYAVAGGVVSALLCAILWYFLRTNTQLEVEGGELHFSHSVVGGWGSRGRRVIRLLHIQRIDCRAERFPFRRRYQRKIGLGKIGEPRWVYGIYIKMVDGEVIELLSRMRKREEGMFAVHWLYEQTGAVVGNIHWG